MVHGVCSNLLYPSDGIKPQLDIVAFVVSFGGTARGSLVRVHETVRGKRSRRGRIRRRNCDDPGLGARLWFGVPDGFGFLGLWCFSMVLWGGVLELLVSSAAGSLDWPLKLNGLWSCWSLELVF